VVCLVWVWVAGVAGVACECLCLCAAGADAGASKRASKAADEKGSWDSPAGVSFAGAGLEGLGCAGVCAGVGFSTGVRILFCTLLVGGTLLLFAAVGGLKRASRASAEKGSSVSNGAVVRLGGVMISCNV
jgi:hypothetical protein